MAEFHETKTGRQFYDKTMPALVKAIERMISLLERYIDARDKTNGDEPSESPPGDRER